MIQFLQPIWLWAISAVLIPVIIHLWNIREGKTLKVGSIAFLSEATRSHAKSVRLSELLLLLLRCLMLILIAVLLAKPVWTGKRDANKKQGWILLPPANAAGVYERFRTAIDSLQQRGHTLHRLEEGFAEMKNVNDTGNSGHEYNYWQLLASLNQRLPAGTPVYLFTDNQRRHFIGDRPAVALDLHWQTFSLPDTASWTAAAFRTNNDSTRLINAHSSSAGIFYTANNVADAAADNTTIDICIYTDTYTADADYLRAALAATRDFTRRKINISVVNQPERIPAKTDWLFWLSDKPLQQQSATHVFRYATGKIKTLHATLKTGVDNEALLCYRVIDNSVNLLPVWTADAGQVVLGIEPAKKTLYQFNSRFQPQWNDLVWSEQFPKLVAHLILPANENIENLSLAAIDQQQLQPEKVDASILLPAETSAAGASIDGIGWLLVFACLFLERWLSFSTKSRRS